MAMVLDAPLQAVPQGRCGSWAVAIAKSRRSFTSCSCLPAYCGFRPRISTAAVVVIDGSSARSRFSVKVLSQQQSAPSSTGTPVSEAGDVNDKTWKQLVLDSDIPVLVDFWAPWCGPCRMIAPLIDELAHLYAGRLRCLKINTDESPNTATEYGIRSIPTVMIFRGGKKQDTVIGAVPKATLISTIDKFLNC